MSHKITIITIGTWGDVQPYIPLGKGLQEAGYQVKIAAPLDFATLIQDQGLSYAPVQFNEQEMLQQPEYQVGLRRPNLLGIMQSIMDLMLPIFRQNFQDFWEASQGADAILGSFLSFGAYSCAEKLNIPCFWSFLQPLNPTREFPSPFLSVNLGIFNRLPHHLVEMGLWLGARGELNDWRKQTLGLPALPIAGPMARMREQKVPFLLGYSPTFIPKPVDWAEEHHVTGYWLPHQPDWTPPDSLVSFLEAGEKPLYVGFGGMPGSDSKEIAEKAIEAIERTGQRAVLLSGWAGIGDEVILPASIYKIDFVPFGWLFPRVKAAIHHGGAGTNGWALWAGIPSVTTPFVNHQFDFGNRIYQIGAGTKPIPATKATADQLATAIQTVLTDSHIRQKAQELGETIRTEDGVANAVAIIQRYLDASHY